MIAAQDILSKDTIKEKLKEAFGYDQFRGTQEAVITNILAGRNTFVIMPTGAGKSLCYQLPAILKEGTALVISPLIALMKNQVDQLNALGINAQFLNSTLNKTETNRLKKDILDGKVKLVYVAPESLVKEENLAFLQKAAISFVAVDEAHCISEWGHDFRPEYRKIRTIVNQLNPELAIIALTATATPKVQQDIQRNLLMEEADLFKSSFNRANLYYEVRPKVGAKKQLIKFVKSHAGKSGIVYCLSRKKVEEIASLLSVNGVKALPYHAGLDSAVRVRNQDAFLNEDAEVIVATIAFGMGIDKPDVRFVIHYDAPKSLEGYYQETGRAGRDGLEGNCLLFYSYNDILKLEKFNKDKTVAERENGRVLLQEVTAYSESSVCRRKQLLHYFGEQLKEDCGFCDSCKNPKEKYEGKALVKLVLEVVVQTGERFGVNHIADVMKGIENQYVKSYEHQRVEGFGKGGDESIDVLQSVVRQTVLLELLEKDIEHVGVLKLTSKGKNFLAKPYSIMLSRDHDYEMIPEAEEEGDLRGDTPSLHKSYDPALFEQLKALRKKVAKEKNVPPYVVFQDPSLEEMATVYPTTREDLSQVVGVGMGKVQKFGDMFIKLITDYVKENDIITPHDVIVRSAVNKSKIKIFIIQQVDKKVDLEEVAEMKKMTMSDLLTEVEHICYSGTKLNLGYYIDQVIDEKRQEEIYDYFMSSESDDIQYALEQLDNEYTEEELRLVRVKFLSEVAN